MYVCVLFDPLLKNKITKSSLALQAFVLPFQFFAQTPFEHFSVTENRRQLNLDYFIEKLFHIAFADEAEPVFDIDFHVRD